MPEDSKSSDVHIPVLTDIVAESDGAEARPDVESLIAELQTHLASRAFSLTEEVLRTAFSEMEATLFEQITNRLRQELPELIDAVLREHLEAHQDE